MQGRREPAALPAPGVVEPGSRRWYAWLYAGADRERVATLFEIEHEIESSLRPGMEHQVAHLRLAWWREECARFERGTPAHPATRRLREVLGDRVRDIELAGLVEAAAWDLAAAPPETREELEQHCARWARAMIAPLVHPPATGNGARTFGAALRETELLLLLAPDARRGRVRLPLDELDALGVEPRVLAMPPWPDALAAHVRRRLGTLRGAMNDTLRTIDAPALHAWAAVVSAAARRGMRSLPRARNVRPLDGLADTLHAWRAARAATRGAVRMP